MAARPTYHIFQLPNLRNASSYRCEFCTGIIYQGEVVLSKRLPTSTYYRVNHWTCEVHHLEHDFIAARGQNRVDIDINDFFIRQQVQEQYANAVANPPPGQRLHNTAVGAPLPGRPPPPHVVTGGAVAALPRDFTAFAQQYSRSLVAMLEPYRPNEHYDRLELHHHNVRHAQEVEAQENIQMDDLHRRLQAARQRQQRQQRRQRRQRRQQEDEDEDEDEDEEDEDEEEPQPFHIPPGRLVTPDRERGFVLRSALHAFQLRNAAPINVHTLLEAAEAQDVAAPEEELQDDEGDDDDSFENDIAQ